MIYSRYVMKDVEYEILLIRLYDSGRCVTARAFFFIHEIECLPVEVLLRFRYLLAA